MNGIVYIHADESCLGVQFTDRDSPGGAAGLVEYWTSEAWVRRDYWVSEPATTNNRMALRSAIEPLAALKRRSRVMLVSDSEYLIKGLREWVNGWIRRGWRRRNGPVENEALWRELVARASEHEIDPRWIRGHAGHPRNEYANALAIRAARQQNASGGLVESGFEAWLEEQREKYQKYFDFYESAPPPADEFRPIRIGSR